MRPVRRQLIGLRSRHITRHRDGVSWVAAEVSGGRRSALARSVRRSQACRRRRCRACGSIASQENTRSESIAASSINSDVSAHPPLHTTMSTSGLALEIDVTPARNRSAASRDGSQPAPPRRRRHAASTADRQCRTRTTRTPAQYGDATDSNAHSGPVRAVRQRSLTCGPTRAATTCSDERSPLAQFSGAERRAQRAPRGGLSPGCRPTHRGSTTDAARSTAVQCRPSRPSSHRIGWSSR